MTHRSDSPDPTAITGTSHSRHRTLIAVVEVGAAALMVISAMLPWLKVDYLGPGGTITTTTHWTWIDLESHFWTTQTIDYYLIPYGAVIFLVSSIVGWNTRGATRAISLVGSALAALVGVIWLVSKLNSAFLYPTDFATLSPQVGLWIFAACSIAGLVVSALDVAWVRDSIRDSRTPSARAPVGAAIAAMLLALLYVLSGYFLLWYGVVAALAAVVVSAPAAFAPRRSHA
jgi:hypothetical protein